MAGIADWYSLTSEEQLDLTRVFMRSEFPEHYPNYTPEVFERNRDMISRLGLKEYSAEQRAKFPMWAVAVVAVLGVSEEWSEETRATWGSSPEEWARYMEHLRSSRS